METYLLGKGGWLSDFCGCRLVEVDEQEGRNHVAALPHRLLQKHFACLRDESKQASLVGRCSEHREPCFDDSRFFELVTR